MPTEIERKFLVRDDTWRQSVQRSVEYRQGYLANNERCSVRVRISDSSAFLNIKSAQLGASRLEYEYPLPPEEARELLMRLCEPPLVEKMRHFVQYAGYTWEVDEFGGENQGLVVAEVELSREHEVFERPAWLGDEVTDDPRYYNVNLIKHPYRKW